MQRGLGMLGALAQRAITEATALSPPYLPPGVTALAEDDPVHAQYLWLCERSQRMEGLAQAV